MVSLSSSLRTSTDYGVDQDYIVDEFLRWVRVAFYVFLERFNNVSQEREYAVFRSRKRGDEITLHSNSNTLVLGYRRLDDSGVLLAVTKWKILGFMESEVVRWIGFKKLSKDEIDEVMDESNFVFRESESWMRWREN